MILQRQISGADYSRDRKPETEEARFLRGGHS